MENDEIIKKINKSLDKIRPYLQYDGGDVTLEKYENDIAYIKMGGACLDCFMAADDFSEGVALLLKDDVPELKDVILIGDETASPTSWSEAVKKYLEK